MKIVIVFLSLFLLCKVSFAQNNVFPASGNIGIGTENPQTGLQLGNISSEIIGKQISIPGVYNFETVKIGQIGNGNSALEFVNHSGVNTSYGMKLTTNIDNGSQGLQFQYASSQNSYEALDYKTAMFLNILGNIGIGTITPQEKLSVNGKIRAKEVKVEASNWPDYVFKPGYKLASLSYIEKHTKEKGHLPDIPSAYEIEKNGVELGEMNKLLLKKIEELTLHLIEKDKQLIQQEKKNKSYEARLLELEKVKKNVKINRKPINI